MRSSLRFPEAGDRWAGGVLAPDGKIYALPRGSNHLLTIDPDTDEVVVEELAVVNMVEAFGSVLGPEGNNLGDSRWWDRKCHSTIPWKAPVAWSPLRDMMETGAGEGGVLAPDGRIYGVPGEGASSLLVIDPLETHGNPRRSGLQWGLERRDHHGFWRSRRDSCSGG